MLRIRPAGLLLGVAGVALDQRHHRDAGLEAGQAERQLREDQQRDARPSSAGCRAAVVSAVVQSATTLRVRRRRATSADGDHDDVQREVDADQDDRDADRLAEAPRKTAPSSAISTRVIATSWPCSSAGTKRVLDDVRGGVGGRQGDRDHEVGGDEAEQHQDEQLALPPATAAAPASRSSPRRAGSPRRRGGTPAARRAASARPAPAWRSARARRRRGRRCRAGSRASRSSRRRSGTSPSTRGGVRSPLRRARRAARGATRPGRPCPSSSQPRRSRGSAGSVGVGAGDGGGHRSPRPVRAGQAAVARATVTSSGEAYGVRRRRARPARRRRAPTKPVTNSQPRPRAATAVAGPLAGALHAATDHGEAPTRGGPGAARVTSTTSTQPQYAANSRRAGAWSRAAAASAGGRVRAWTDLGHVSMVRSAGRRTGVLNGALTRDRAVTVGGAGSDAGAAVRGVDAALVAGRPRRPRPRRGRAAHAVPRRPRLALGHPPRPGRPVTRPRWTGSPALARRRPRPARSSGIVGFHGPPDERGMVEVAYGVDPALPTAAASPGAAARSPWSGRPSSPVGDGGAGEHQPGRTRPRWPRCAPSASRRSASSGTRRTASSCSSSGPPPPDRPGLSGWRTTRRRPSPVAAWRDDERLHPRPPRVGAALAPVADGGELRRLPAAAARAGDAAARRRLRTGHDHHGPRRAGRARGPGDRARAHRRRARPGPGGGAAPRGRQRRLRGRRRRRPSTSRTTPSTWCTPTRCCSTSTTRSRALREMRRVCRPGGIVAARDSDYAAFTWYPAGARAGPVARARTSRWPAPTTPSPTPGAGCCPGRRAAGLRRRDRRARAPGATRRPIDRAWWGGLWADRIVDSDLARQAVERGLATR